MNLLLIVVCCLACTALVWSEAADRKNLRWLFKPIAATCFVLLALNLGALENIYGRWLLAGLCLCWLGDVFLIPDRDLTFLLGLGSFLLGHLGFAVAFSTLGGSTTALLWAAVPVLLLGTLTTHWLWPQVPADMKIPVVAYILVICAMLLSASSVIGTPAGLFIAAGAWGFAVSDVAVARDQFISPGWRNRLWGLPLYFGSQLLLAWSVAS